MISDMAAYGAAGLVSVAANVWPRIAHEYVKKCLNGRNPQADIWQQACEALFIASNPIPTKALLHDIGLIEHQTVRLPLSTEDLPSVEKLRQVNKMILGWKELATL